VTWWCKKECRRIIAREHRTNSEQAGEGLLNTVLIVVRTPGGADIELMTGHPFSSPQKTEIRILAER